jgi:hypothetical protein
MTFSSQKMVYAAIPVASSGARNFRGPAGGGCHLFIDDFVAGGRAERVAFL